jgi:cell division protein DivIC
MGIKKAKKKEIHTSFPRSRQGERYSMYRLITVSGFLVIVGLLIIIGVQYLQYYRAEQELANLEKRVSEQETRQESLQEEIERLQSLDYIEILARDRLGLVKPGEIIFQLED